MLTKRGVKLLDFGVAKLLERSEAPGDAEQPTRQKPLTDAGALLGTVQYMAPEQLEGQDVDARTDIFAFGAVLYEMITGKKAFEGESQASVIGAILKDEPAPLELQPTPPRGLERIIRKCVAKDPDDRYQTPADLRVDIDAIQGGDDPFGSKPMIEGVDDSAVVEARKRSSSSSRRMRPSSVRRRRRRRR